MNILLTNDDGIHAPGIHALYKELKRVGRVTVVAPQTERSSVGHGITLSHPVWVTETKRNNRFFGYGISGTPADCVKFGIHMIMKKRPDVVISGINFGPNDGCSVFYSGTVAGAREGTLMGIPAMAISLDAHRDPDFAYAAKVGRRLARIFKRFRLTPGTFLNVNVPHRPAKKIKGIRITRQGTEPIFGSFQKRVDPNFREYYWMTGQSPSPKSGPEADTHALRAGYVTVTPVQCDLTDVALYEKMKSWKI